MNRKFIKSVIMLIIFLVVSFLSGKGYFKDITGKKNTGTVSKTATKTYKFTRDEAKVTKGENKTNNDEKNEGTSIKEDGSYTSKEDVAKYLMEYKKLPGNFITKKEASSLGWIPEKGNLNEVAPGKSIGGDYFGNFEGKLPKKKGLKYYEVDIDYKGGSRGAKRIIYSSDGDIYYTDDHYKSFTKLN